MKSSRVIFFLIPVLLIGVLSNTAFAESGPGYDKKSISFPDKIQNTLTITHPRILDSNGEYQRYIFTENINSLQVETMAGSVTLDKTTCGFSFHNKGYLNNNPTPLFSDSIIPRSSVDGTGPWNEVTQISNAVCVASWDGSTLTATKAVPGIGLLQYKYINTNGIWKTQLEVTNLTGLTDRHFGFDQTVNLNRDTVFFGGQTRNLDNFHNTTFDRTWIENNETNIINFLNGYYFDFDISFPYLNSITVIDNGVNSSQLVFHFRTDYPLLPNETLILDPTITQNTGGANRGLGAGGGNEIFRGEKVTASSALNGLEITEMSVWLKIAVGSPTGTGYFRVYDNSFTLQHTFGSLDITTVTSSYVKYTANTGSYVLQTNDRIGFYYDAGDGANFIYIDTAGSDVYDSTNSVLAAYIASWSEEAANDLRFELVYDGTTPPDAIDDLTSPDQSYGSVDLLWTQPELHGGNLTGYQVNYTTPWGNPLTTITNNTQSSGVSTTVSGLSIGTDYTFGVSAWTEGGNNSTKPPMVWLNVTTQGNFTIGNAAFNQTNTQTLPITFEEQSINSTAKFLNVTFANTYTMACDFAYKFAQTNQTYNNMTSYAVSTTLNETAFIFNNFENEIISVNCYDTITGTDADYLLRQNDFPLLQQIASFKDGTYGTEGKIGVFDFITIAVVIFSMIGLNRVNESVGAIFNTVILGSLAYFGIIELPTVIFGFMAVVLVFVITSTRKPG